MCLKFTNIYVLSCRKHLFCISDPWGTPKLDAQITEIRRGPLLFCLFVLLGPRDATGSLYIPTFSQYRLLLE